jgi:hypothetical protein
MALDLYDLYPHITYRDAQVVSNEDVAQKAAAMFCARDFGDKDRRYSGECF